MHEWLLSLVFYGFAALTVIAAFFAVVQRNPVRGVLFLVLAFFGSAGLWMLARAEFLSLVLILVYVGAVMTLFLFVVMMLNVDTEMKASYRRHLPWLVLGAAVFIGLLMQALPNDMTTLGFAATLETQKATVSNTAAVGMVIFQDDILAFELAAMILLVAIIAAITLTHRRPKKIDKKQDVVSQIMTRRDDSVSLVRMKAERPKENV